jgi:hypothetical protein
MVSDVLVNLADGGSLFDEPEHVDRQHLLVGKGWIGVVTLPLSHSLQASSIPTADEQVDPNKRRSSIHVAKGGYLKKMLVAPSFKPPAATWFFNP